ncbi:MAG: cupin domain-containing protein [Pseudomonadota bacterium]
MKKISLAQKLALFSEAWQPKIIADFNDCEVRLTKLQGPFLWHSHKDTDELFLVVSGELIMEFRDRVEHVKSGEIIIVPRGMEHRTNCLEACAVMILAKKDTLNTGDHDTARSVHKLERI